MKKTRKILLMAACAVLLVCISVGATVAYLTSTDTVTNTFTVGQVAITLDEAKVDMYGDAVILFFKDKRANFVHVRLVRFNRFPNELCRDLCGFSVPNIQHAVQHHLALVFADFVPEVYAVDIADTDKNGTLMRMLLVMRRKSGEAFTVRGIDRSHKRTNIFRTVHAGCE